MIHFDEIKDMVIACLKNLADEEEGTFYVIRDVYGKISVYMTGTHDPRCIEDCISHEIGSNWVGQVRTIDESSILYDEISKTVEKVEDDIYYGERPLVKKAGIIKQRRNRRTVRKTLHFIPTKAEWEGQLHSPLLRCRWFAKVRGSLWLIWILRHQDCLQF